jgi:hypothetical protein
MKLNKTSGYAKYLVLADRSKGTLRGDYLTYLDFRIVKDIVNRLSLSDKASYLYESNIYSRKVTSTEAKSILENINNCTWNDTTKKMLLIASQLKVRI